MSATATAAAPKQPTTPVRMIDVVQVDKGNIAKYGGAPWCDVMAAAESGDVASIRVPYWNMNQVQRANPNWVPPLDQNQQPMPFLPLGSAWLREVDGRAFLYIQNW